MPKLTIKELRDLILFDKVATYFYKEHGFDISKFQDSEIIEFDTNFPTKTKNKAEITISIHQCAKCPFIKQTKTIFNRRMECCGRLHLHQNTNSCCNVSRLWRN